jgi:hypothetical protein
MSQSKQANFNFLLKIENFVEINKNH